MAQMQGDETSLAAASCTLVRLKQPQPKRRKQTPSQILEVIEHNSPQKVLTCIAERNWCQTGNKGRDSLQGLRGQYCVCIAPLELEFMSEQDIPLAVSPDLLCGAGRGQDQCTAWKQRIRNLKVKVCCILTWKQWRRLLAQLYLVCTGTCSSRSLQNCCV